MPRARSFFSRHRCRCRCRALALPLDSKFARIFSAATVCALTMTKSLCRTRSPPNPPNRACPPNHAAALQSAALQIVPALRWLRLQCPLCSRARGSGGAWPQGLGCAGRGGGELLGLWISGPSFYQSARNELESGSSNHAIQTMRMSMRASTCSIREGMVLTFGKMDLWRHPIQQANVYTRPLVLSSSGLLIWLVQSGVCWHLGAVLGWRPSASLLELADRSHEGY